MADRSTVEFLRGVPLFHEVGKRDVERLANSAHERTFAPGTLLAEEGTVSATFLIIMDGEAEVIVGDNGTPVAALGNGDYFGEMALFESRWRNATVRAKTAITCLVFVRWGVLAELLHQPEVTLQLLISTMRRLRETTAELAAARGQQTPLAQPHPFASLLAGSGLPNMDAPPSSTPALRTGSTSPTGAATPRRLAAGSRATGS